VLSLCKSRLRVPEIRVHRRFPSDLEDPVKRAVGWGSPANQRFRHPGVRGGRGCSQHRTGVSVRPNPQAIEIRAQRARPRLDCWISVLQRAGWTATSPCLMRDPQENAANHRHHSHGSEQVAYLSLFPHDAHHDDDMTVTEYARD